MSINPIIATYLIETPISVERAAEVIAGEQSSGTFLPVPGETEELRARARAKVIGIELLESVAAPSLPGARSPGENKSYQRAEVRIAFPFDNIGCNLPTLLGTVCGNLYELAEHSGCKLLDLELPDAFAKQYPGPQFGIDGTRRLTGVYERPIIGTIVKPSVGLSPEQTAELVRDLGEAGIDFVKDDELMASPPHSPLEKRVQCVMREIDRLADRTGRRIMYAVNISDEIEAMKRHHDCVVGHGGTCVMVSLNHVGFAGVSALRGFCQVPIHGHRNGWGMFSRHPLLGIEFTAWQKLWRAVGVDHLHVNGLKNKFWEPDDSVIRSIAALRQPLWGGHYAMPVISSGQWGGQAPETLRQTGSQDVLYVAGGGIMAHPGGPVAGLRGIQQAWAAAARGIPLEQYAASHVELRQTIETFGGPSMTPPLLAYYGDDFTGSADVMEVLTWAGLRTVLFLEPPTKKQLAAFEGLRAFGIAGWSRSMSPAEMDTELKPALEGLRSSGSGIIHYKICSTFDSSPEIGSIGRALELGLEVFGETPVPIVIGAPNLGRYQIFGNLFARSGLDTEPFRLDRHPTMRQHPITPMTEADIRQHLALQTNVKVGLVDILRLNTQRSDFDDLLRMEGGALLFDVLYAEHLPRIGAAIQALVDAKAPAFVIGSSGIEYALTAFWSKTGRIEAQHSRGAIQPTFAGTDQMIVITGSCSPVNARQIAWAEQHGYELIALDPARLIVPETSESEIATSVDRALKRIRSGANVILHSSLGPEDVRVAETLAAFQSLGFSESEIRLHSGRTLGPKLGQILSRILEECPFKRVAVAGGDTSGYVARELGITALEAIAPVAPGSPLCRVHANNKLNGIEIFFKGGQVGKDNVWETMLKGTRLESTTGLQPVVPL